MDSATRAPRDAEDTRVALDGRHLSPAGVVRLADAAAEPVVPREALARAHRSWRAAGRLAAGGRLYGRGTGVGAHRSVPVDSRDEAEHGLRLLRSHAGGAGAVLPARQIRAMLAVRANQLLAGGSGIQPAFVTALTEALRLGVHPAVNEYGGLGTGDLTALAQTGLTLIGERPWLNGTPAGAGRSRAMAPQQGVPGRRDPGDGLGGSLTPGALVENTPADGVPPARGYRAAQTSPGPGGGAETGHRAGPVAEPEHRPGPAAEMSPRPGGAAREAPLAGTATAVPALPAPVVPQPGDALALLSSNALTLGQAALACHDLDVLLRATHAVAALSLAAVSGSLEAYADQVHALRPYPGAARAAAEVRRLSGPPGPPHGTGEQRIQDPFGFRAFPQAHGPALQAADALRHIVEVEVNCPSENPLISADGTTAYHHGGFYAAPLGLALDALDLAVLQTAQLSAARLAALGRPDLTGLPAFLAEGPPGSSGTMILEYTANSALAELRACAAPASAGHAVLSHGLEEAASFASQAARQALRAVDAYATVLACELVVAVRALRRRARPPRTAAFAVAAAALPAGTEDRPLTADVTTATEILPVLAGL
ncbi:aromatic amino acid lyase [Streptomyces sp. NRRL S-340]|uniref:aromatic amino acid lyase n=1 Tax=Streptomyces sp. NRRL S-340 TaxID=1463901 RepID=UPI00056108DA|nr:aromatic amino acid lyase [Streptomyces sp. NRRL S-340]